MIVTFLRIEIDDHQRLYLHRALRDAHPVWDEVCGESQRDADACGRAVRDLGFETVLEDGV